MATAATQLRPLLNVPRKTVAQSVSVISSAFSFSYTTPKVFGQDSRAIGAFEETNRYSIFIYASLNKPCATKRMRGGCFGPFTVSWTDSGGVPMTMTIGYNSVNVMQGTNSALPVPGNSPGQMNSMMAGHFVFIAAPGTVISVTAPYSGDAVYAVNLALETF